VDDVINVANKRTAELVDQRKKLSVETEFYRGDTSKFPPNLKRQLDENTNNMAAQQRFIENQGLEKKRINAKFDEELKSLQPLWAEIQRAAQARAADIPKQ